MPFASIDFELANANPTSICALGVATFSNTKLINKYRWLIRPPHGSGEFAPYNTQIHGITPDMVYDAPLFCELWQELYPIIRGMTLVAHNAPFDTAILRKNCSHFGLYLDGHDTLCSCQVSRKLLPELFNHKLCTVSAALGVPLNHHDPVSDAVASGMIILEGMKVLGVSSPQALAKALDVKMGYIEPLEGEMYV